jgi:hypothetical protein
VLRRTLNRCSGTFRRQIPTGGTADSPRQPDRFLSEAPRKSNATTARRCLPALLFDVSWQDTPPFAYTRPYPYPALAPLQIPNGSATETAHVGLAQLFPSGIVINPSSIIVITINQTALEKVGRKLRFPDNFFQSQTEIHNFRTALAKVVRKLEKSDGIRKSRTETGNSSRKFSKSDRILNFRPAFSKVVRNLKK